MEILFIILFLVLATPIGGRAAGFVGLTFWTPYFLYVGMLFNVIRIITRYANHRQTSLRFGYSYKFCIMVLKNLYSFEEVVKIMKGVRFDKPHDYICDCDKKLPKAEQTNFKVRFLTAEEQAELRDAMYSVTGMGASRSEKFLTGTVAIKALEIGLQGWDKFTYDNGEDIPFSKENFSAIPPKERDEIANYIRGIEEEE
jgi:hypothetical protein